MSSRSVVAFQVVRELADAWSRTALQAPFLAEAINVDDAAAVLSNRLHRLRQEWT